VREEQSKGTMKKITNNKQGSNERNNETKSKTRSETRECKKN
jgi:hypothetical protein